MNVGDLRKAIANLPATLDVVVQHEEGDVGDLVDVVVYRLTGSGGNAVALHMVSETKDSSRDTLPEIVLEGADDHV